MTDNVVRAVPKFRAVRFREKSSKYCVCVFVINENGKLQKQLAAMQQYVDQVDIVIADGGSDDGSTAPDVLNPFGVAALLVKEGPGRLGAQMRMAFAWALDEQYDGVITMDGNNKDAPEALPRFVEALEEGYDHVQGSRFISGGQSKRLPWSRWLAIKSLHAPMIRWASRFPYTDTTNGFRAYSARALSDPNVDVFRDVFSGYELHYYLAIRMSRLGFRVKEVPVTRSYPRHGAVPTKISPVRGNLQVLRCLLAACLGYYNPRA
jgi:dolichol-phosphate mannosyltransferase